MVFWMGRSHLQLVDSKWVGSLFVDNSWVEEGESCEGSVDEGGKYVRGKLRYCFANLVA